MPPKTYENPLIPNARMRQLFRAVVESRELTRRLRTNGVPREAEAAYAAGLLDLEDGDLVSTPSSTALTAYIRAIGARPGLANPSAAAARKLLKSTLRSAAIPAYERLLMGAGAAQALAAASPSEARTSVVLAYAQASELRPAQWKQLFNIAQAEQLPLILFATGPLPADKSGLPIIPVDGGDVLALYRVAQESILRARTRGGPAAVECLAMGTDPLALLRDQLVSKRICTPAWAVSLAPKFRKLLTARA